MLQEEDYIFPLDEDQMVDTPTPTSTAIPPFGMSSFKMRKTSPSRLNNLASGLPSTGVKSLNVGLLPRNRYVRICYLIIHYIYFLIYFHTSW